MKNVFIIGSKGIPANYGGFETFVEYLTKYKVSDDIKYHVACLSDHEEEFEHNQAVLKYKCLILDQQKQFIMILQL